MPGLRLNLSIDDKKVINLFFSNRTYKRNSDYLKLIDTWKSTNEIKKELGEPWIRSRKRLERLAGFGLLEGRTIDYKGRRDHYYYITKTGVYFVLSTLPREKMVQFLRTNKTNTSVKEFSGIEEMVLRNDVQIRYFTRQILSIVKNYQYYLLEFFIQKWIDENKITQFTRFFPPNFKKVLKRNYGKDKKFLGELSRTYGKIE